MHTVSRAVVVNEEEREQILEQLNRMLESHLFKNSRRYPTLLKFIVEETLDGRSESLRERPLGVHVFDRPVDYDTASDPIVRVTVAEIRKRIAQYYHDEEHDAEIRIELLPGRYTPEFHFRTPGNAIHPGWVSSVKADPSSGIAMAAPSDSIRPPTASAVDAKRRRPTLRHWFAASMVCLVCVLAAMSLMNWLNPSAIDKMWAPLLRSPRPILFCIPTGAGKKRGPLEVNPVVAQPNQANLLAESKDDGPAVPTFLAYESRGENVVYSDMLGTLSIANVLAVHHHDYYTKLNEMTNLDDLRQGPTVLIGGMDNQWTMLALAPLRFHFAGSEENGYWIADQKNPGNRDWSLDLKLQYVSVMRDYAIVARLHNKETGQPEMIVAGIGMSGTAAAGEFVADEKHMDELRRRIGPDFKDRDFEVVLSTDVVNGIAGSPTVVAVAIL
jgi:hypothetical protein